MTFLKPVLQVCMRSSENEPLNMAMVHSHFLVFAIPECAVIIGMWDRGNKTYFMSEF